MRRGRRSTSSAMDEESEAATTSTMRPSKMTSSGPAPFIPSTRRVPALPQEYDADEEVMEMGEETSERLPFHRTSSTPTTHSIRSPSRHRSSSSTTSWLLLPLLLLQLLQPVAACPDGCKCDETTVKCAPGTFREFPYILPSGTTHLDLSGNQLVFPDQSLHTWLLLNSLHTLIMRNCSLSSLPGGFIDGMASLRVLDLAANDIREVDVEAFSGVQGLEHLDLSFNRRLSLPLRSFDRLETLRTLDLSGCGLRELEQGIFHGLEQLEELKLKKNSLSMLPRGLFSQQRMLRELDLGVNQLDTTSSLSSLPALKALNLADNSIKYMDRLDHLVRLERLDASHNHVLSLPSPPSFPSSLRFLDLSHNHLRHLQTAAFDTLTELRHLNLSHNKHLENVQINVFVSLSSLEYLSLAHCSALVSISPAAFQPLPSSLRTLNLGGINILSCSDCKLRSFPDTVELRGKCEDQNNKQHFQLADLGSCEAINVAAILILGSVVVGLLLILVLLIACCKAGSKDSRPVTPATAKHANYGYGGHRKPKKHSSLSPPLLASSSSSSTSPSGRGDVGCHYEARLGAGPIGGGIIYGTGGYLDWDPVTMLHYGGEAGRGGGAREAEEGSSSGNSSGRSDYSEIPAYTQNRYCVPRSTVARAFSAASVSAPGAPRLPQTPPPTAYPQGMFPASGTLYPPPKYSPPPPPPTGCYPQQDQPQLIGQTPLALQQQLHHQQQAYSPLTRL